MTRCRYIALAILWLSFAGAAFAQETTGALIGRLQDTQGLALPGVTVTVTGGQGVKTTVSDADGSYRVPFLTPGQYVVRAELQGFKTVEQKGVTVSLGQTTTVNMSLEVGGLTETVQVTGTTAVVDTTSTTTGAVLSADLLQRVPVGRRFTDALYLAPGVSSSGAAGTANPSMSGSSGLDNLYVVDGVNITNTGYGAVGSYSIVFGSLGTGTPFDFVQEVQVKTGGYEAEFGQSMGGVVNVVTKSGSNDLRGSVFGYFQPSELEGAYKTYESPNGTVNTVGQSRTDTGVEGGFPVVKNRLFFFGAINPAWETRTFTAPEGFPLRSLGDVDRKRRITSYSAKGTYQLTPTHRIDASFFGDPAHGDMGPQRTSSLTVVDTSSYSELDYGGHNQTVRYDGVIKPTWLAELSYARAQNKISEVPSVDQWRVTDTTVVPQVITGGIGLYEKGNDGLNHQYAAKTTYMLGGHQVRGGFLYEDVRYANTNQRTGPTFTAPNGQQTLTGASVNIISDPAFNRIYRVTRANFVSERVTTQNYWSFFLQDTWRVGERLTINPGIRYEQQTLVGTSQLITLQGNTIDDFALKGNWAPRVGAVYDLLGNGRSRLYGNYGRFFARIPNDLAARSLSADAGLSRADYFDANLTQPVPNGVLAGGQTNHYVPAGTDPSEIDENAKLSYKDEYVAGFEYEAWPNINLGVRYIHRNLGRVIEDVAPIPVVAYDLGLPGTELGVAYVLTNPDASTPTSYPQLGASFEDPRHDYDAVELTFDRRFSNNWSMLASYRWSRLRGTFEGFFREDNGQSDPGITSLYDFPTNDPSYATIGRDQFGYQGDIRYLGSAGAGPLPLDRPHQFKVSGNRMFGNLSLGLAVNLSSGKPLTALEGLSPYGNTGEVPLTPRGGGFQTVDGFKTRTPFESQVDLQGSYSINMGNNDRLTLLADMFNLFNLRRTLDYNNNIDFPVFGVPNPNFGTPTSANVAGQQFQRPFQLRLGIRYAF
ncbi:MAG TPA: TonB-dependent receptor [Vicinamibacterales bacterium]|nr:TonB-dependent receptor [Vicinamibacterales bacterium]